MTHPFVQTSNSETIIDCSLPWCFLQWLLTFIHVSKLFHETMYKSCHRFEIKSNTKFLARALVHSGWFLWMFLGLRQTPHLLSPYFLLTTSTAYCVNVYILLNSAVKLCCLNQKHRNPGSVHPASFYIALPGLMKSAGEKKIPLLKFVIFISFLTNSTEPSH